MGKKGSWFSAIKRVFTPNSKDKPVNVLNNKMALKYHNESPAVWLDDSGTNSTKEKEKNKKKKKGLGKLRHGETNSFIPLFREPSSIEKIFGDFEREQQRQVVLRPPESPEQPPRTSSFVTPRAASLLREAPRARSPRAASPPREASPPRVASPPREAPRAPSPRVASPPRKTPIAPSPRVTTPPNHHQPKEIRVTRPRAEPSLRNQHDSATRIQAAYRGHMGRRSLRALKGLVRLQGVVRGQNVKRQTVNAMKYMQLVVRVQSQIQSRRIQMLESQARRHDAPPSVVGINDGDWDDSVLTKEQLDVRMQRKVEAIVKRERSMAYAYSHQLWKASPKADQTGVGGIGRFPWWYSWLERQMPATGAQRPFESMETATPRSSKSTMAPTRTPRRTGASPRPRSPFEFPIRDNDSLTSCPAFSVPSYMAPTVSAKAKSRATSNPKDRFMSTPTSVTSESKRRLSFPLTQAAGSFNWNKAPSVLSTNTTANNTPTNTSRRTLLEKPNPTPSVVSVDSTVSMPAAMGRKPFNRFV